MFDEKRKMIGEASRRIYVKSISGFTNGIGSKNC